MKRTQTSVGTMKAPYFISNGGQKKTQWVKEKKKKTPSLKGATNDNHKLFNTLKWAEL